MLHRNRTPITSSGLLLSLAAALPTTETPLARRARHLASRLRAGGHSRALLDATAACMASLLTAADRLNAETGMDGFDDEDGMLLAGDFDA